MLWFVGGMILGQIIGALILKAHADPLPHRPISEIDIQGHQPESCGDRIPLYSAGFFIECLPIHPAKQQQVTPDILMKLLEADTPQPLHYPKYDTPEAAAIAALKQIAQKPSSAVYEWGGIIGKTEDGKYIVAEPMTDWEGDHVTIMHGGLPPNASMFAAYHTHPCIPEHDVEFFSPDDLMAVLFEKRPMAFLGDLCTGNVHEFKYGDRPDVTEVEGHVWLTKGRIIGKFSAPQPMAKS